MNTYKPLVAAAIICATAGCGSLKSVSQAVPQVGGDNRAQSAMSQNQSHDTWATKQHMLGDRDMFGMATTADHVMLAVGGEGKLGFLHSVEAYDPIANRWGS
jgi:hypothetical protein